MTNFKKELEENFTIAQRTNNPDSGILQYFTHKDAPERLLINKVVNGNQIGVMDENTYTKLIERVNHDNTNLIFQLVHSAIKRESTLNFCGPNNVNAELFFDSGKFNLKSLLDLHIQTGATFHYSFLCEILSYLIGLGGYLEDNLEYMPSLRLDNIVFTNRGFRMNNPYLYDTYISEQIFKVLGSIDRIVRDGLVPKDQIFNSI